MKKQSPPPSKSPHKKNQYITNVYTQIMSKYGKQSITSVIQEVKPKNIYIDTLPIYKTNQTLPKLQLQRTHSKSKKYFSNRLIVNQSVYIHQRKQTTMRQFLQSKKLASRSDSNEAFDKIQIPKTMNARDNGILVQRNKRILQLYKKVQNKNMKANVPSSNLVRISSQQKMQSYEQKQSPKSPLKSKQQDILLDKAGGPQVLHILKQQYERKNKIKFPKMSHNLSSSNLNSKTLDYNLDSPQKSLKCTKYEVTRRFSVKLKNEKARNRSKNRETHNKSDNKLNIQMNIASPLKKRKFNWRRQQLKLERLNKDQFYDLLRGYAGIYKIQQVNSGFYRAYIGSGNNCALIKKIIKQRNYWTIVDSLEDQPHFVWTQLQATDFSNQLVSQQRPSFEENIYYHQNSQINFQNDFELKQFLKFKKNDFICGCQKIMTKTVFTRLIKNIKERFKVNGYLQNFRKIRYLALENLPNYKIKSKSQEPQRSYSLKLHNHTDGAHFIGNKKDLFKYLTLYAKILNENIDDILPKTVHINQNQFQQNQIFLQIPNGPWILKPGEQTNRGQGISVHLTRQSLLSQLSKKKQHVWNPKVKYTNLIQQYISPLLYNNRKFDIRIWVLWNASSKQAWWYQQGYIRTSCRQFTYNSTDIYVHLTNDAIQSQAQQFGKFQPANKISFNQLNKYIQSFYGYKNFYDQLLPLMKELAIKVFRMGNILFDPQNKNHTFQLFGLDYLIDSSFKPWLIQCNTNPSLEVNCSLLTRLVSNMLENVMNLTVDAYFPPPTKRKSKQPGIWHYQNFKFQLLYDGSQDIQLRKNMEESQKPNELQKQLSTNSQI